MVRVVGRGGQLQPRKWVWALPFGARCEPGSSSTFPTSGLLFQIQTSAPRPLAPHSHSPGRPPVHSSSGSPWGSVRMTLPVCWQQKGVHVLLSWETGSPSRRENWGAVGDPMGAPVTRLQAELVCWRQAESPQPLVPGGTPPLIAHVTLDTAPYPPRSAMSTGGNHRRDGRAARGC